MKKLIWLMVTVFIGLTAQAQSDADIWELVKTDLKTEYKTIIIENMDFSDAEADKFWPIFNNYMVKKNKVIDENLSLLKEYAANYDNLTGEKADELVKGVNTMKKERLKNRIAYYKALKKALGSVKAAKLYQIDGVINTLFDFQIVTEIPIIQ